MTVGLPEDGLPEAVPSFRAHFTDPVYDSEDEELAPFGSNEGWELVSSWGRRPDELGPDSTIATVLDVDPGDVREVEGPMEGTDGLQTASAIRGAAFTLLRLAGHLGEEDRSLALDVIDFELTTMDWLTEEERQPLLTQRADLASWTDPA